MANTFSNCQFVSFPAVGDLLGNSLAQYQQSPDAQLQLQQANVAAQMQRALAAQTNYVDVEQSRSFAQGRAESWADEGWDLVVRIAFWRAALGPLACVVTGPLAKRLNRVTDNLEGWIDKLHASAA